jgi:hypothetical protein
MTSQIAKRNAAPSRGLMYGIWKDWVAGAVLLLVWTTLWTVFTAGVLAPAAELRARSAAAEPAAHPAGPSATVALREDRMNQAWVVAR